MASASICRTLSEVCLRLTSVDVLAHKGQRGRIAVVGGSEEYTGAPYFAAMAALRIGADLVHIFCHPAASIPIKSYSPELIVHPLFSSNTFTSEDKKIFLDKLGKIDVVVLGPGCGSSMAMQKVMETVISESKVSGKPLVCDADVFRTSHQIFASLIGHQSCVLTPNTNELSLIDNHLAEISGNVTSLPDSIRQIRQDNSLEVHRVGSIVEDSLDDESCRSVRIARQMKGVIVCLKGRYDTITDGRALIQLQCGGGIRRCGGQGDLLAGAIAALLGFYVTGIRYSTLSNVDIRLPCVAIASAGVRLCAKHTEKIIDGYMSATDMLKIIGSEFKNLHKTFLNEVLTNAKLS